MKTLSIIVPTYNAQSFLDKGLNSFLLEDADAFERLEVLVVNDGSTDESKEIAQKYVTEHPNVFVIVDKENGGHGSAINAGVAQATGKYFKVVDADDWVDTDELGRLIAHLDEVEDFDAAIQSFRTYNITTKEYEHWTVRDDHSKSVYTLKQLMERWQDIGHTMTFHGVLYNTEFYRNQKYDLTEHVFYEDQEYATIPLCRAKTIRLIEEEFYVYRIGDANQSVAISNLYKRLPDAKAVLLKMLAFDEFVDNTPEGGYEYWMRKVAKIVADIYHLTLIRNKKKRQYRTFCKELTNEIKMKSPRIYEGIKNKYKVFVILNRLHVGEWFYDKVFMRLLNFARKTMHVEKLHG